MYLAVYMITSHWSSRKDQSPLQASSLTPRKRKHSINWVVIFWGSEEKRGRPRTVLSSARLIGQQSGEDGENWEKILAHLDMQLITVKLMAA